MFYILTILSTLMSFELPYPEETVSHHTLSYTWNDSDGDLKFNLHYISDSSFLIEVEGIHYVYTPCETGCWRTSSVHTHPFLNQFHDTLVGLIFELHSQTIQLGRVKNQTCDLFCKTIEIESLNEQMIEGTTTIDSNQDTLIYDVESHFTISQEDAFSFSREVKIFTSIQNNSNQAHIKWESEVQK